LEALKREITYHDEWEAELKKAGLPEDVARHLETIAALHRPVGTTGSRTASNG
jgi:hypothetical protein